MCVCVFSQILYFLNHFFTVQSFTVLSWFPFWRTHYAFLKPRKNCWFFFIWENHIQYQIQTTSIVIDLHNFNLWENSYASFNSSSKGHCWTGKAFYIAVCFSWLWICRCTLINTILMRYFHEALIIQRPVYGIFILRRIMWNYLYLYFKEIFKFRS